MPGIVLAPAELVSRSLSFNPTLLLWLNLAGTFVFGLTGGLAAIRARLHLIGIVTLSAVVALAGGITRDVLIGVPPAMFRDGRYLAAVGAAALVSFVARPALDRVSRQILLLDAVGLSVFCVTGAGKAVDYGLGPVQAMVLGAITAVGGGILRDMLLGRVPSVLRDELYVIPAVLGAAVVAIAHTNGSASGGYAVLGACICLAVRLIAIKWKLHAPFAPGEHR